MKVVRRIFFLLTILLGGLLLTAGIALQIGISVAGFSIQNVRIEQSRLNWDSGLNLHIGQIIVQPEQNRASGRELQFSDLRKLMRAVELVEKWFSTIRVEQLKFGRASAEIDYRAKTGGQVMLRSPQLTLDVGINVAEELFVLDIKQFHLPAFDSVAQGQLRLDTVKLKASGELEATIASSLPVRLRLDANQEQLRFAGEGIRPIESIAPVVGLFKLDSNVSPWVTDYLSASEFSLTSVSGSIPYDTPETLLHTLQARVDVRDVSYTFAQGLEPITAVQAEVQFKGGVLSVQPSNAHFYDQGTGNSDLHIDFSHQPFILTANIKSQAQASGGVLSLLEYYGIHLPFEQVKGLTDTDLILSINLSTGALLATGNFQATDSVVSLDGRLVDVSRLNVDLDTTKVSLNELAIKIDDLLSTLITGEVDFKTKTGELQAQVDAFRYQTSHSLLELQRQADTLLEVHYTLRPEGGEVSASASSWMVDGMQVDVAAVSAVFDQETLSAQLTTTPVTLHPWLRTEVAGTLRAEPPYAELDIVLLDLVHDSLKMDQERATLKLTVGDSLLLSTQAPTDFTSNQTTIRLLPTRVMYVGHKLLLKKAALEVAGQITTGITGHVDFQNGSGKLVLQPLKISDLGGEPLFYVQQDVPVDLSFRGDAMQLDVPLLGLKFDRQSQGASTLQFVDLSRLSAFSPVLDSYQIHRGELLLGSATGALPWSVKGSFESPLALLVEEKGPVTQYRVNGRYDKEGLHLGINDNIRLELTDNTNVYLNGVGFNLPAVIKYASALPQKGNSSAVENMSLNLEAKDGFIFLAENHRIVSDELKITIAGGEVDGDVHYREGYARIEVIDGKLSLMGKNFDQAFLNEIHAVSDFEQGEFEFQLSGTLENLDIVLRIEDAVLKDYAALNNILFFVNSVPGLLTFNVSEYDTKGLSAHEIYIGAHYRDGVIDIKTVHVDSDELDISGEGQLNLDKNNIEMSINLITSVKKSIGRIPLLGYVLSGDKKNPSITLTISGDPKDPKIKHTAYKSFAAYPFKVLKRAVILPGHLVKTVNQKTGDSSPQDSPVIE